MSSDETDPTRAGTTFADGIVLVHGGYHGAWCWDQVRPKLDLPATAVDLPGRGRRPAEGTPVSVSACVDAVLADADAAGISRMVLVGHSMGGITITETANRHPDRVAHLVYLAALVLPVGGTTFDLYGLDRPADPAGTVPLMPERTAWRSFSGDLSPEAFAAAHRQCVPEPAGLFAATVSGYDSGVPATYIRCTRDAAVPPAMAGEMIARLHPGLVREIDSDHDVMLSHPDELAAMLNAAASG